ncbi:Uncharacterised protein [Leminorella richardii]|uniref:Uncharacterized protein n=2 Tax=Leminorella richardii TaxID=158841 RepID=A0A2X4V054_9GAMM|nr:Uncharacterised protein [Leminorella richardii]
MALGADCKIGYNQKRNKPEDADDMTTLTNSETDTQRQTLELLTQLHNTGFITDGQFASVRPILLRRSDLRFNTAYRLFTWLVEQGLVDDRPDRQMAQATIEETVELVEKEAPLIQSEPFIQKTNRSIKQGGGQVPRKEYKTPFYIKLLVGFAIVVFILRTLGDLAS